MKEALNRRNFLRFMIGVGLGGFFGTGKANELDSTDRSEPEPQRADVWFRQILSDKAEILPVWKPDDRPAFLSIPQIGFESDIQLVKTVPTGVRDNRTYEVPNYGVATPNEYIFENMIFIFGHSRWDRGPLQDIARITDLNLGDTFLVRNQRGEKFFFMVCEMGLYNPDNTILHEFKTLELVLQTTAIDDPKEGWILKEDKVLAKVGENRPDNLNQKLAFAVGAVPVELRGLP